MKRMDRNWNEVQSFYDSGMTWRDVKNKFQICHATLAWARKNKLLKCRTMSAASKLSWKNGNQTADKYRTPEFRKKMSKFGGLKLRSGRCKHVLYTRSNGKQFWLQGSWEVKVADCFEKYKVEWTKNRVGYKYSFAGKDHLYFPDFWLKDLNIYVEVKGYETDRDKAKWSQFPFKLLIVKKEQIQDLNTWWKNFIPSCCSGSKAGFEPDSTCSIRVEGTTL